MKYFDIHSHLNLSPLKEDQESVLSRMRLLEVATITVGVDYETSKEAVRLAEKNFDVWATVGLHPTDNSKEELDYEKYKELAQHPKVVAIGETGLDYFHPGNKEKQKDLFLKHTRLALEVKKPLMIHCRPSKGSMDAYNDLYEIITNDNLQLTIDRNHPSQMLNVSASAKALADKKGQMLHGNLHFFVGDTEIAKKFLKLGFTFSFDGPITFSRDYDEVIKFLPLESLMSETDAPFAAPVPYRGKTNEPAYVVEIVKKIAEIKGLSIEVVQKALVNNARRIFDI
ncbi:hypothetical protein A3A09_00490 [Candidatus Nomurabacteria bacterium RIFCSPLOWO2_01_FULL_42_20]|uniref:Hydrolase TatD n=1 Tax=Candidatus Nomurabacteria bacterium RIFCSPHIGHO2_01_FULL_42_16 TaxID=1801743 RepID=A0A1F6VJ22_9BACT|nr:MAG: hypothetical protein A2824_02710 [Candidatus Nomurabacteria bacterium RIFCSPHIGHO2_01_FULL_42_16]OGI91900.1 MAG: hypothetical protein A3A09_00490 [Candidatus Nomurabacteria bacterium RIFCSPLOWO2_01_FULL_42_20]